MSLQFLDRIPVCRSVTVLTLILGNGPNSPVTRETVRTPEPPFILPTSLLPPLLFCISDYGPGDDGPPVDSPGKSLKNLVPPTEVRRRGLRCLHCRPVGLFRRRDQTGILGDDSSPVRSRTVHV